MNIDALKRDLDAKIAAAKSKLTTYAETAKKEDRPFTDAEKAELNAATGEVGELRTRIERLESDARMGAQIEALVPVRGTGDPALDKRPSAPPAPGNPRARQSLGQQFVSHESYKFFANGHHRTSSAWRSPVMELMPTASGLWAPSLRAGTLTTDPSSGGDLIIPDYQAGIQPTLFRRLTVADLIASGTTDSNLITYMKEATFTNAADSVAEGTVKPESTLAFDAASDPVRKIAHWLPVTEEMLEDVAQVRSYIDSRLSLGIQLTEEDQLLNGSTTPPDIVGIRSRTGLAADVAVGIAPDTPQDAVFRQIMMIFATSYVMPDGIVMNPTNWAKIQLLKTSTGEYIGGGPFGAPAVPTLWGLPIAVTPAIEAGVALVGAFGTAAQVFRKGGIRIEASNSHADFFVKNLVAIRAEERLALAVYRPAAFGEVTALPVLP